MTTPSPSIRPDFAGNIGRRPNATSLTSIEGYRSAGEPQLKPRAIREPDAILKWT